MKNKQTENREENEAVGQFRRYDGLNGNAEQYFIDSNLPICPLCGLAEPRWMIGDRMEHTKRVTLFRCSRCGGILATDSENLGAASLDGVHSGDEVPTGLRANGIPMKILSADQHSRAVNLVGRMLPMGELKTMASGNDTAPEPAPKVSPPAAATVPAPYGARPAEPQAESFFVRSPDLLEDVDPQSPPVYAAPNRQPSYAAPSTHPSHSAPNPYSSYAAPSTHPSHSAPNPYSSYAAPITHSSHSVPDPYSSYVVPSSHPGHTASNPYPGYGAMSRESVSPYHATYAPAAASVRQRRKFPVLAVIMLAVAAAYLIIEQIMKLIDVWEYITPDATLSIYFFPMAAYVLMLVGMILNQRRSVVYAVSCFMLALISGHFIYAQAELVSIYSDSMYYSSSVLEPFYWQLCCYSAYVLVFVTVGIVFCIAKPQLAIIKNIAAFLLMGTIVAYTAWLFSIWGENMRLEDILHLLLGTIPMCLSIVFYTPFKEQAARNHHPV